jgi:subtilisin family serine protease
MGRLVYSILGIGMGIPQLSLGKAPVRNFEHPHISGSFIVGLKGELQTDDLMIMQEMETTLGGEIREGFQSSSSFILEVPGVLSQNQDLELAEKIAENENVAYVEANTILSINEEEKLFPNDPQFSRLWGLHNKDRDKDIDAPEAWKLHRGSQTIKVAIIDTGVDTNHPDLLSNIWKNPGEMGLDAQGADRSKNKVDDDGNGYIDDVMGWDFVENDPTPQDGNGHGTHCAGTIGAQGNNGIGVAGVNWSVSMVGLRFMNAAGSGSLADAVKAIEYGTALGVDVMSNSWGGGGYSQTMERAIQKAGEKGILFVAAAGNDGLDNDKVPHYPSSYTADNLISVAATDDRDGLASFSNWGARSVHIGAPGVGIYSTYKGGGYATLSGTSMATPHVAGAYALLKARLPGETMENLKKILLSTGESIPALTGKTLTPVRLNIYNALSQSGGPTDPGEPPLPLPRMGTITITSTGPSDLTLAWENSGQTPITGLAARISKGPLGTLAQWETGTPVSSKSLGNQSTLIEGIPFRYQGYITMRPLDEKGRLGELSPSIAFALPEPKSLYHYDGSTLLGLSPTGDWGLEKIDNRTTFTDSPGAPYGGHQNVSLNFSPFAKLSDRMQIEITHRFDLEKDYDFAYLEFSLDQGKSWRVLKQWTGSVNWQTQKIDLLVTSIPKSALILLRARMVTDSSTNKDGWWIDDLWIR